MIRRKWSGVAVLLGIVSYACGVSVPDRTHDQSALAYVDSLLHDGMSDSTVTTFFEAEGFNWTFEPYPDFLEEVGLDSIRMDELRLQGLRGRYVALAKTPASGRGLFGGAHVRLEIYMNTSSRSIARHSGLQVVK